MQLPKSVPRCSHKHINGLRCGSPAMRGKLYCHFHQSFRQRPRRRTSARPVGTIQHPIIQHPIALPPLEDAAAVQVSLMRVLEAITTDALTERKAGLMLYALQTAAHNLKQIQPDVAEALVRQDYPETAGELLSIKQHEELNANGGSLVSVLLKRLDLVEEDDPPI
ncbi:MAG TPA: hypothetical protein VFA76_16935 [Terriglobales bacterium]|nr:hypothetical protein [Terriglobales bacterium]